MKKPKCDIEGRLIDYAVCVVALVNQMPKTSTGNYLGGQILRSGVSPALNYGEAKSAESRRDFIHKMKVCLKELRESYNCLRIIQISKIMCGSRADFLVSETNELISIFVTSINTASQKNS